MTLASGRSPTLPLVVHHADVVCFVSSVHPVAVLNAALCMTCSLLLLVEDARGDHMEEACSRDGPITALYGAVRSLDQIDGDRSVIIRIRQ